MTLNTALPPRGVDNNHDSLSGTLSLSGNEAVSIAIKNQDIPRNIIFHLWEKYDEGRFRHPHNTTRMDAKGEW